MEISGKEQAYKIQYASRNLWSGVLFGLGMVAFLDEALFHQILGWHHFYDKSTTEIGLLSDGLFHAFSWFATVGSLFMVADLRRRNGFWLKRWYGGVLLGAGGFNLYDGIVHHKILKVHQIRYDTDNLFLYDVVWNSIAAVILIIGIIVTLKTRHMLKRSNS
ncbi:DUF2243 domain-containing protein [Oceanobacillus luteolus]|uniref:DUF2243 domain-containing protein n=1 Tax=Oceanobacillus luteolus TaxID=1274358 RepID=A0ABW4HVB6_9BACI|nr:DUF2243 domain-containing protein [Oceanobacillus luteolus]MCM3742306.1 DUF2243 domain-containing protein [Oceanobacillus luteolus]